LRNRGAGIQLLLEPGQARADALLEPGLDAGRDRALETHRLVVRFGPAKTDHRGQQPLQQRVTAEDAVGGGPTGRREMEVAPLGMGDETIGYQPAEHLAGGLGRDPEVAGDERRGHPSRIVRTDEHPKRQQIFLGGS